MKILGCALLVGLFCFGCSTAPRQELAQFSPPSDADLIGTYAIAEESMTHEPLASSSVAASRLQLLPGGKAQFVNFPLFSGQPGERYPHLTNGSGTWTVASAHEGYQLIMDVPEMIRPVHVFIAEGGNPSDLIFYYGRRDEGRFSKWRRQ